MSQKYLLIVFCLFFVAGASFLFWKSDRELNQNDKNFWTLSFAYPERKETLDFVIENFSDHEKFEYTISTNKQVLMKDTVEVKRTKKVTVKPLMTAVETAPTIITVTADKEKKEIYRK